MAISGFMSTDIIYVSLFIRTHD